MNVPAKIYLFVNGEKYLDGEKNYIWIKTTASHGTASRSGAVNINANDATLSNVCLYTKGKIPIQCIYSAGFSGYI